MLDLTSVNLKKLLRPGPSSEAGQTHALELDLSDAQTSHRWKWLAKFPTIVGNWLRSEIIAHDGQRTQKTSQQHQS